MHENEFHEQHYDHIYIYKNLEILKNWINGDLKFAVIVISSIILRVISQFSKTLLILWYSFRLWYFYNSNVVTIVVIDLRDFRKGFLCMQLMKKRYRKPTHPLNEYMTNIYDMWLTTIDILIAQWTYSTLCQCISFWEKLAINSNCNSKFRKWGMVISPWFPLVIVSFFR